MSVGVVTDSTCDIPAEEAERLGICVVPAVIVMDGQPLHDGTDIARSEMYRRLPTLATFPTTASPSSAAFEEAYNALFGRGVSEILSIHVAAKLSGICNAAHLAAERFRGNVRVIDSEQVSLGLGFQVLAAAEAARQGAAVGPLIELLNRARQRILLIAMVDRLDNLRRSGRISWIRAELGNLLQVRLVVAVVEGTVRKLAEVRTRARGLMSLVDTARSGGALERVAVLHVGAEGEARSLLSRLRSMPEMAAALGPGSGWLVEATPVIGIHAGQGAVGLAGLRRPAS